MLEFLIIFSFICYHHLLELSCRPQDNVEGVVATQWQTLTHMLFVQDVARRVRGLMTVKNPQSTDCKICNAFSEEQRLQLATPSYRIKKEKREAKKLEATPAKDGKELIDPSNVSVIGPVEKQAISPTEPPPDKKTKKDTKKIAKREKYPSASTSKASQGSMDDKIATLDSKWSERFNRLEALLLARNMEPKFSADVKVTPAHSPPASVTHSSEPFIRPSSSATLPGTGSSAERHQPTSKAMISQQSSTTTKFPGTGSSATKHQPASQTKTSRPASSKGSSALTHQPASQTKTDRPNLPPDTISDPSSHQSSHRPAFTDRPTPSDTADSASPVLHRSRQDSVSSFSSEAGSDLSDRPPLTCMLTKESYLKIRSSLLWIKISQYQKSRLTGTLCRVFAPIWAGPISLKLTVLLLQPKITPLLGPKLLLRVKSLSKCPQKNGCAKNSPSST